MKMLRFARPLTAIAACLAAEAHASESPPAGNDAVYTLSASRVTVWAPGVPGGIPRYTEVSATLLASSFGPGARDARAMVQEAIDAAADAAARDHVGRVVLLSAGVFHLSGELRLRSQVVLRGAGPDQTRLVATGNEHPLIVIGSSLRPHPGQGATDLAATGEKGARSVRLSSAAGFAAGQLAYLDELTDDDRSQWNPQKHPPGAGRAWFCRENRPITQILEIANIAGDTVTFTTPLHIDFRKSQNAQLSRFDVAPVTLAGVEELRLSSGRAGNLQFDHAAACWVRHIETDDSYGSCLALRQSFHCEVRDSYLHDSYYYNNGGAGYGFDVTFGSSDNLIENNIAIRFNKVINCRASGGGNVIAYNYVDDGAMNSAPDWIETGLQASHYPTPHHELFEGNDTFNMDGDFTEGNAIAITFFRNHASGTRRNTPRFLHDTGNRRMAGAMRGHYDYNFVGNVLGDPCLASERGRWVYESAIPWENEPFAVWRIGYWDQDRAYRDARVADTMIRDGNFDFITDSVHWHRTPDFRGALPASLYLKSKPAFFGDRPWPWVDPLGPVKLHALPAKARYDAGTPNRL